MGAVDRGYPGRLVYTVNLGAEAVAASTAYVLVDLSDSTNYPHSARFTNFVNLLGWELSTEKASDGQYDLWIGVIYECDATNGSAQWVDVVHIEASGNAIDSTDRLITQRDYTCGGSNPSGICCRVNAAGDGLAFMVGNQEQAGNTNWQTDTGLASPVGAAAGATGKPGPGDIVIWLEETGGTGTCDWNIVAHYEAW